MLMSCSVTTADAVRPAISMQEAQWYRDRMTCVSGNVSTEVNEGIYIR